MLDVPPDENKCSFQTHGDTPGQIRFLVKLNRHRQESLHHGIHE
jgi:hypothetical protein